MMSIISMSKSLKKYHGRGGRGPAKESKSGRSSLTSSINSLFSSPNNSRGQLVHVHAAEAAEEVKLSFRSSLPQSLDRETQQKHDQVATFQQNEVVLGPKLGSGEFSHVYEIKSFALCDDLADAPESTLSPADAEKRVYMKKNEKYRQTDKARYALKHIKGSYLRDNGSDAYIQAARDLAGEAEFLTTLEHPHIIKLRGMAQAAGFRNGPAGYFLVIDRLSDTLDQRIKQWHGTAPNSAHASKQKGRVTKVLNFVRSSGKKRSSEEGLEVKMEKSDVMDECLHVAMQIASALMYMHSAGVIFRDLKPANIGFDVRGDVKVFDFGLARTMPDDGSNYTEVYEMSGAGSPRYMAPECLRLEPYNLKVDVYSYAIVLHQMLSGETPYGFVTSRKMLYYHVVEERGRPRIVDSWDDRIKGMLESSFDADMKLRPKMKLFYDIIRDVLASLRGSSAGLSNTYIHRRRTVGSMMREDAGLTDSFIAAATADILKE